MTMKLDVLLSQDSRVVVFETEVEDVPGVLERGRPLMSDARPFEVFVFASGSGVLVDHDIAC